MTHSYLVSALSWAWHMGKDAVLAAALSMPKPVLLPQLTSSPCGTGSGSIRDLEPAAVSFSRALSQRQY